MNSEQRGKIITFYSYKGGVGRSMALANVGVLLAEMGKTVLLVDWDLEAPGLEEYFRTLPARAKRRSGGLLELLGASATFDSGDFASLVTRFQLRNGNELCLLDSGCDVPGYAENLANFSWVDFIERRNGAEYLEQLRELWLASYDFVLIDSRTGITDAGGICTIQMPDTLVLLFAANHQNLNGVQRVAERAKDARDVLPFSRLALSILPVPSRFDGRVEQNVSSIWLDRFAERLAPYYEEWIPQNVPARKLVEQIKIPYIPLYSFDEALPVITQGTSDPEQIGFYYKNLARLLASESAAFTDPTDTFGIDQTLEGDRLASPRGTRKLRAMISSTATDLPEHRTQVIEACLRSDVYPIGIEQIQAGDSDALTSSLRMVDEADVFIGVYAWRYGWVPAGEKVSLLEMEFARAVERGIPILVFLMHKEHPITIDMVQSDAEGANNLAAFKARACEGRIHAEFKSPLELRGQVIEALGALRVREDKVADQKSSSGNIPRLPEPYVAHPYVLLQTANLIGRQQELEILTDWITKNAQVPKETRILSLVAIGGMGKSALAWKWFEDIVPNELPSLAGRIWWSFYEDGGHWETFIIRALGYAAGMPEEEVRLLPSYEREDRLLRRFDEQPFLLVLDGLERILLAYARIDAAQLPGDDPGKQSVTAGATAPEPPNEARALNGEGHRLRRCTDPRAGAFLRKLARIRSSRILISTRLYPADLETQTAQPLPGCYTLFLRGLTDNEAFSLWRAFIGGERSGTFDKLRPLFQSIGNHPLLLRALAGQVARYRPAPGDFDRWHMDHSDFDPAGLPLQNARTNVLEYAVRGLSETPRRILQILAAFRGPATWDVLRALLKGEAKSSDDQRALDAALTELEDRGLVGWDTITNRYELHPIVRGFVWSALDDDARRELEKRAFVIPSPR